MDRCIVVGYSGIVFDKGNYRSLKRRYQSYGLSKKLITFCNEKIGNGHVNNR